MPTSIAKSNAYLPTAISQGNPASVAGGSQRKPQLSQEQFEMIMSEQEDTVKRNLMKK
jgi:hypothetical protein